MNFLIIISAAIFTITSASPIGLVDVKSESDLSVAETGYHPYPDYSAAHKHGAYGHHAGDHGHHLGSLYGAKDHYADGAYGANGHNHYNDYGAHGAHGGHHHDHANGFGHGLYTRNRGYGFEKHYAYDKELATHKNAHDYGSNAAHGGHYGHQGQNADGAHNAYGYNKHGLHDNYGAHNAGKYGHLLGSYGNHGYGHLHHASPYHGYPHYPHPLDHPLHHGFAAASAPPAIQIAPVGPHVGVMYQ